MKINVIIIGTGNIGKRHIQAIHSVSQVEHILCYDIDASSCKSVINFCKEQHISPHRIQLMDAWNDVYSSITSRTIVIVATIAKGRSRIINKVMLKKPMAIIAEKPLCQNMSEYKKVIAQSRHMQVPVYINFARHMYECYKEIKRSISGNDEKLFTARFSGGMACSGIHMFELATWLLGIKKYSLLWAKNTRTYKTKRKGYFDFNGEIMIRGDNGSTCFFSALKQSGQCSVEITYRDSGFTVNEMPRKMIVVHNSDMAVKEISITPTSKITDLVVKDIISHRTPLLPNIDQSLIAHSILFDYMSRNRLSSKAMT